MKESELGTVSSYYNQMVICDDLELLNNEVVYVGNKIPSKGIVIDSKSGLIALLDKGNCNNGDIVKRSGEMFKYLRRFTQSDLEILKIYDWKSDIGRIMRSKKNLVNLINYALENPELFKDIPMNIFTSENVYEDDTLTVSWGNRCLRVFGVAHEINRIKDRLLLLNYNIFNTLIELSNLILSSYNTDYHFEVIPDGISTENNSKKAEFMRLGMQVFNDKNNPFKVGEILADEMLVIAYKALYSHSKMVEDTILIRNGVVDVEIKYNQDQMVPGDNLVAVTNIAVKTETDIHIYRGEVDGICVKETSDNAFGFDAKFKPNGSSLTFAELENKDAFSSRAKAVKNYYSNNIFKSYKISDLKPYIGELQKGESFDNIEILNKYLSKG